MKDECVWWIYNLRDFMKMKHNRYYGHHKPNLFIYLTITYSIKQVLIVLKFGCAEMQKKCRVANVAINNDGRCK